jgi:hypothetical protein
VTWQLFFDVLAQSFESAAFLVQENIETDNGYLQATHLPDLYRVVYYITHDEGRFLYTALRNRSVLYQQKAFTCSREPAQQEEEEPARESTSSTPKEKKEVETTAEAREKGTVVGNEKVTEHLDETEHISGVSISDGPDDVVSDRTSTTTTPPAPPLPSPNKYVPYSRPPPEKTQHITIDLTSFERRPFNTTDEAYLEALTVRCTEWIAYLKELVMLQNPYTRTSVLEFIDMLVQLPVPIQYVTLHYLVADGLFYSIELVNQSDYFDWIILVFISTRFFVGLSTVNNEDFSDMMSILIRHTAQKQRPDLPNTVAYKITAQETALAGDIQIPPSVVRGDEP